MSAYPSFKDLGKSTKDFFAKGFQIGNYKLSIKDHASKNIKATVNGTQPIDSGEATGEFEAEMTCPVFPGYTSKTKWTTANILHQELSGKDMFKPGLALGLEADYNIDNASISGKAKTTYNHSKVTVDAGVEGGDSSSPTVGASFVTGYQDFAAGYQVEVDVNDYSTPKKNNAALAYVAGPISFLATLENANILWSGLVYRLTPDFEIGATATYNSPDRSYTLGGAFRYIIDCCTAIKAKVTSNSKTA